MGLPLAFAGLSFFIRTNISTPLREAQLTGVPFFKANISEEAIESVGDVLRSGWLTSGAKVAKFEKDFAAYVGQDVEAVAVNSATAGLHLALEACCIEPGDEVIVPTLTFTASAEVAAYLGAKVVLVDVLNENLCGDFSAIEAAITERTRAVIFVHFAGFPVDISELVEICRKRNLALIEDLAHALPSRFDGKQVGASGSDAAIFSFYANKTLTTGEGGMIVTKNAELARRCRLMRTHGIDRDSFSRFSGNSAQWQYDIVEAGYKYNLTDIAAAIGLHQLAVVEDMQAQRVEASAYYDTILAPLPLILPPRPKDAKDHSWHLYCIQVVDKSRRQRVFDVFSANSIGYSVHYTPLHQMTYWKQFANMPEAGFPVTDAYFSRCLSLPLFPTITRSQQDEVFDRLREALSD